jgi:hypothetical protein
LNAVRPPRAPRLAAAWLAVILGTACTDAPATGPDDSSADRPQPGVLVLQLEGGQPGDAAFQLIVTGVRAAVELSAPAPLQLHTRQRSDTVHAAVFGTPQNGVLLQMQVPDVRDLARYGALLTDVAQQDGALRSGGATAAYRVRLQREP